MISVVESNMMDRIEGIEEELEFVKKSLKGKNVKMGGRLEGAEFKEEDFEEAKKALFKRT